MLKEASSHVFNDFFKKVLPFLKQNDEIECSRVFKDLVQHEKLTNSDATGTIQALFNDQHFIRFFLELTAVKY